jgi:two-component system, OmpR family, response regulator QseB
MRILLVEDDLILGDGIAVGLRQAGNTVDWFRSAEEGQASLRTETYSVMVLDIGLSGMSGLELLGTLRRDGHRLPVLLLTARDSVQDRIRGLDAGADDYLVKPFALDELGARLRALHRRGAGHANATWRIGAVEIDPAARTCRQDGTLVVLTPKEFAVLSVLVENIGTILSRERIALALYAWGEEAESNAIDVHIHHLRRKLGEDTIRTMRGVGYVIDAAP